MQSNLALLDLARPYLLRGENLGPYHPILSILRVTNYEQAEDDFGITIRGRGEFNGWLQLFPNGTLAVNAGVDEGAPVYDPSNRQPTFDLAETAVEFELFVPRAASAIVTAGQSQAGATAAFAQAAAVLDALNTSTSTAPAAPSTDYPSTGFTLDLLLDAPTLRPPGMTPAKLAPTGTLVPDPSFKEVTFTLPKLRFRASHGNAANAQLRFDLVSLGATGLDDPGGIGEMQALTMTPPYAYLYDNVVGIGFRTATLDFDSDSTPPAIRDKAGVGDDWTGIYLPEARIFISPSGVRHLAFEAGAHELLIGIGGDSSGIWGDLDAALVEQGDGKPILSARFVDAAGSFYGIEPTGATTATAHLPAVTRMVIELTGGRMPYTAKAQVGSAALTQGQIFEVDLTNTPSLDIAITAADSSPVPKTVTLTISVTRVDPAAVLPTPITPATPLTATPSQASGELAVSLVTQTATQVVVTTSPEDGSLMWSIDGGAEQGPSASVTVPLNPGEDHLVTARKPASGVTAKTQPFYYFFDKPPPVLTPSTSKAIDKLHETREGPDLDPIEAYRPDFEALPNGTQLTTVGQASYENLDDAAHRRYNYLLAGRRAADAAARISAGYSAKGFDVQPSPQPSAAPTTAEIDAWVVSSNWHSHVAPNDRDYWSATVELPANNTPGRTGSVHVSRPAAPNPPQQIVVHDPPPTQPDPPGWFRSAKVLVRLVKSQLIAMEVDTQLYLDAFVNDEFDAHGINNATVQGRPLQNGQIPQGAALGPGNTTDGITNFRVLVQADPSTGRIQVLGSIGADPADTSGLLVWGWLPGETPDDPAPGQSRNASQVGREMMGSYLTFWPLLADLPLDAAAGRAASESTLGAVADVGLSAAAMALPAAIALLPWLQVERVVLYGAEVIVGARPTGGEWETDVLVDVGIAWSTPSPLIGILTIAQDQPLTVRYKAIGVHTANRDATGAAAFQLHPIFDASKGYTIDVQGSGALKLASPFDKLLRILAARLSRTNPLTLEIDIGMSVDLGVVTVERAAVRAYLDGSKPPELTALGLKVDIVGALVGSGYAHVSNAGVDAQGNPTSSIGGQLDLTLRPIGLRVAAAVEIAQITQGTRTATGVYVGLSVVLPAGIPLGTTGLGIFGFRGIFGMHYQRNPTLGAGTPAPALTWLKDSGGHPELLTNNGFDLWQPSIDHWAFGLGMMIGTMEGGYLLNLDGTLILELPGPRLLIAMSARIIHPPPSLDGMGSSGGILAVIEITPDHFLIGVLASWEIPSLIKISIPVAAMFPMGANADDWYFYLGARADYGTPIEVDVLGIVKGTGYFMARGKDLKAYKGTLDALNGFNLALGFGASFTWGDTDVGLYLRIGGGFDAELGFNPLTLEGTAYVSGELRLFIVSIGADANLTIKAVDKSGSLNLSVDGKACGHVSFLFFEVSGCVHISIDTGDTKKDTPSLVDKVTLQSRSPALAGGTGLDRGIDTSLGNAVESDAVPGGALPVVPIDSIPIISLTMPANVTSGLTIGGLGAQPGASPGVDSSGLSWRGSDKYTVTISAIALERIDPATGTPAGGSLDEPTGPAVWFTTTSSTGKPPTASLGLLTWTPTAGGKAIAISDDYKQSVTQNWGDVCTSPAPAAEVLWTFRFEPVGASVTGWDLEGIAWPDPPNTVRSSPPDETLHVAERWRSGDPILDTMRGVFPALVVGDFVDCRRGRPIIDPRLLDFVHADAAPVAAQHRLVVGGTGAVDSESLAREALIAQTDPVHAALVRSPQQQPLRISSALYDKVANAISSAPSVDAISGELEQHRGLPVANLINARINPELLGVSRVPFRRRCQVRILEAPMFDDGRPIAIGDQLNAQYVEDQLIVHGVTHGPLDNVLVLHTGAFATFGVLLFIPRNLLEGKHLIVRGLGADGSEHEVVAVTAAHLVGPHPLPARWTDPAGPWASDISDLMQWQSTSATAAVFVRLHSDDTADRVEIGTHGLPTTPRPEQKEGSKDQGITPPYFVAAISATRWSEVARSDWDSTQLSQSQQVVTNLLGSASDTNAFMFADSLYRITVTSTVTPASDPGNAKNEDRHFWFRTDKIISDPADNTKLQFASTPPIPVRLDSWLMMTSPEDNEKCYFGHDNVKLVFNTQDVDRLFADYGKKLQVRFQASSAQHPESTPGAPHPFPIDQNTVHLIGAAVLSPFEEALVAALGSSDCIDVDDTRIRHSELDVPIYLNACTDYILDVELVDANAEDGATGPSILRRHFSTGLYASLEQFAGSIVGSLPSARSAPPGVFDAIRTYFAGRRPAGNELDDQFHQHQLGATEIPGRAGVVVFWEQTGSAAPQPVAVLVDAMEPIFRSRKYPTNVPDPSGMPGATRWDMNAREWLVLRETTTAGVVAADGILPHPGGQRVLVVLAPNSRGKHLQLDLAKVHFADLPFLGTTDETVTVVDLTLSRAPWEEA